MHPLLQIFLISLDHCSYNNIAKRQEQYAVFSVLISPVSDRGKNTSSCNSQLPFLYIKGSHQSFPRTSHWESCWVTCLLWPLNPFQSFLRHSLPIVQKGTANVPPKYYTHYTRRKVCGKQLFWTAKKSPQPSFPKSV